MCWMESRFGEKLNSFYLGAIFSKASNLGVFTNMNPTENLVLHSLLGAFEILSLGG